MYDYIYIYIYIYVYIYSQELDGRTLPPRLVLWIHNIIFAKLQIEGLQSHIQIHRIMCQSIVNPSFFSGKVSMQEFKAPGSGRQFEAWTFENRPYYWNPLGGRGSSCRRSSCPGGWDTTTSRWGSLLYILLLLLWLLLILIYILLRDCAVIRESHLSNTTCLTQVFFKGGE